MDQQGQGDVERIIETITFKFDNADQQRRFHEVLKNGFKHLPSSSRGEQGWRTIDSAPKDGTKFLAWWDGKPIITYWAKRDRFEGWQAPSMMTVNAGDKSAWSPTHWMPLPSAPGSVPTSLAGQVPDEPTDEMIHAGRCAISMFNPEDDYEQAKACWRAMVSVAPQAPFTSRGSAAFDTRTLEEVAGLVDAEHVRFLPIDETGDRTDHVVAAVLAELSKRIRAMLSVAPQPTAVAGQGPDDAEHVAQLICDADAEAKSLLTHGECALAKCYLNARQALREIAHGTSGRGSRTDAAVMQTIAQRALGEICEQQSSPQPTAGGDADAK